MYDMIGVTCSPHEQKYLTNHLQMWRDRANSAVPELKEEIVTFNGDRPVIPWKQATDLMFSQLKTLKRVQYGIQ